MPLRLRLVFAVTVLGLCTLLAIAVTLFLEAGPRIEAEQRSMVRLTRSVIEIALAKIQTSADPRAGLEQLVAQFASLRHVEISLVSAGSGAGQSRIPPAGWLRGIELPAVQDERIPVVAGERMIDIVIISPRAADELDELWAALVRVVQYGVLFAIALAAVSRILLRWGLAPIAHVEHGLQLLQSGDYAHAMPRSPVPEFEPICRGLDALAHALYTAREENTRLSARIIQIQDDERREIARDLHDELGPCLFSLRTGAAVLISELAKPNPDPGAMRATGTDIAQKLNQLQTVNRRVLQRLTPPGLSELGLRGGITALVSMWQAEQPAIGIEASLATDLTDLGDAVALTVFRVVQEGLTNAYKHAGARQLRVVIETSDAEPPERCGSQPQRGLVIARISDDGCGIPPAVQPGFGLHGMRDRVTALGGTLTIVTPAGGGTCVEARIPMYG